MVKKGFTMGHLPLPEIVNQYKDGRLPAPYAIWYASDHYYNGELLSGEIALHEAMIAQSPDAARSWLVSSKGHFGAVKRADRYRGIPTANSARSMVHIALMPRYAALAEEKRPPTTEEIDQTYGKLLEIGHETVRAYAANHDVLSDDARKKLAGFFAEFAVDLLLDRSGEEQGDGQVPFALPSFVFERHGNDWNKSGPDQAYDINMFEPDPNSGRVTVTSRVKVRNRDHGNTRFKGVGLGIDLVNVYPDLALDTSERTVALDIIKDCYAEDQAHGDRAHEDLELRTSQLFAVINNSRSNA